MRRIQQCFALWLLLGFGQVLGQCPVDFSVQPFSTTSMMGGSSNSLFVTAGELVKVVGLDPDSFYEISISNSTTWDPEITVFDGDKDFFQYSDDDGYYSFSPTKMPKLYFRTPGRLRGNGGSNPLASICYVYISNVNGSSHCNINSSLQCELIIKEFVSGSPIPPIINPCPPGTGLTTTNPALRENEGDGEGGNPETKELPSGLDAKEIDWELPWNIYVTQVIVIDPIDLRIKPKDSCGNENGFRPATAFTPNKASTNHNPPAIKNAIIVALDMPSTGYYTFSYTTDNPACQVEMELFCDDRLLSYQNWFLRYNSFADWIDKDRQRQIRADYNRDHPSMLRYSGNTGLESHSAMTFGMTGALTTVSLSPAEPVLRITTSNIAPPCSHQGAGGMRNVGKSVKDPCCPNSYRMHIDSVYYLVFNGLPCCPYCIDLEVSYCGDEDEFRAKADPSIGSRTLQGLVDLDGFLEGPCPPGREVSSSTPYLLFATQSGDITFPNNPAAPISIYQYTNAMNRESYTKIRPVKRKGTGNNSIWAYPVQAGRQYMVRGIKEPFTITMLPEKAPALPPQKPHKCCFFRKRGGL